MAFIDKDSSGERFVNIANRVGATGIFDDMLVVQSMLNVVYFNHYILKNQNVIKGRVTVTGRPAPDTVPFISHFQAVIMKRPRPEGYINRYTGKYPNNSTILRLNALAESIVIGQGYENIIKYLKAAHPILTTSLLESEKPYDDPNSNRRSQRERPIY